MLVKLGIDVGNHSTKSKHTIIPSGYEGPYTSEPQLSKKVLLLDNNYYVPSSKIVAYQKDKTLNEHAIVLTLMSIAEELIHRFTNEEVKNKQEIQERINQITSISLGVGLPPTHYTQKRINDTINYYTKAMGHGITYKYDNYEFSFRLKNCKVFPQGAAGAACVKQFSSFPAFYVIDIGGYTVDIIYIEDNQPAGSYSSKEKGVLTLFTEIIDKCMLDHDITLDQRLIENVLLHKKTILTADVKETIYSMAEHHANDIINTLKQSGIEFKAHPCLFMGGGALLLKDYITKNPLIVKEGISFVTNTCVNAMGYSKFL